MCLNENGTSSVIPAREPAVPLRVFISRRVDEKRLGANGSPSDLSGRICIRLETLDSVSRAGGWRYEMVMALSERDEGYARCVLQEQQYF